MITKAPSSMSHESKWLDYSLLDSSFTELLKNYTALQMPEVMLILKEK